MHYLFCHNTDGPAIQAFQETPSAGSIYSSNNTKFTCRVDTHPDSDIKLYYQQTAILKSITGKELTHTEENITCTKSGSYLCLAVNHKTGKTVNQNKVIKVQSK